MFFVMFFALTTGLLGGCATYTPNTTEAMEEYSLNIRAKRAYVRTVEANATSTEINGASNCVAKNFGQPECIEAFGVEYLIPKNTASSSKKSAPKKETGRWKNSCYMAGCHEGARK